MLNSSTLERAENADFSKNSLLHGLIILIYDLILILNLILSEISDTQ